MNIIEKLEQRKERLRAFVEGWGHDEEDTPILGEAVAEYDECINEIKKWQNAAMEMEKKCINKITELEQEIERLKNVNR